MTPKKKRVYHKNGKDFERNVTKVNEYKAPFVKKTGLDITILRQEGENIVGRLNKKAFPDYLGVKVRYQLKDGKLSIKAKAYVFECKSVLYGRKLDKSIIPEHQIDCLYFMGLAGLETFLFVEFVEFHEYWKIPMTLAVYTQYYTLGCGLNEDFIRLHGEKKTLNDYIGADICHSKQLKETILRNLEGRGLQVKRPPIKKRGLKR